MNIHRSRRFTVNQLSVAEAAIYRAILLVGDMGRDARLAHAVDLLRRALEEVGDFVDQDIEHKMKNALKLLEYAESYGSPLPWAEGAD